MSDFDGEMNKLFGGNRANYTVEDIERAKKRQKKCGGTLYENLSAITGERTGQKPLAPIMGVAESVKNAAVNTAGKKLADLNKALANAAGNREAAGRDIERLDNAIQANSDEINATINELNRNLKNDFSFIITR